MTSEDRAVAAYRIWTDNQQEVAYGTGDSEYRRQCTRCNAQLIVVAASNVEPRGYQQISLICTCGEQVGFTLPIK